MESLPNTSDIKMIDPWLILCQLDPFAQVVLPTTAMEDLREEEQEKKEKEKQRKRKRKREKKMKGGVQKGDKLTQNSCNERSLKSANDTTGDGEDLQLDLEIEVGFGQDKPLEAWIPDHSNSTKTSLVTKLLVVGKYSPSASISFILLPEKKVVPLMVLLAFFIYFGVAASFYID